MIVRDYHPDDLEACCSLMDDLGYPSTLEKLRNRMERIQLSPMYFTFVAEVNDKVVGMIGVRQLYSYEHDEIVTQISALVTKHEYQGKGIGKALIRYVENWAVAHESTVIVLTSGIKENRVSAHKFYRSVGFEVTGYRFVKKLHNTM